MKSPAAFLDTVIRPGLRLLETIGGPPPSNAAERLLLAIALQETGLKHRYQVLSSGAPGAARGWWQFERGGGVIGVLSHPATKSLAATLCRACDVEPDAAAVWRAIEGHDLLAAGLARLLVFTDPHPLPTTEHAAWQLYADRLWRPGRPHADRWPQSWAAAVVAVG